MAGMKPCAYGKHHGLSVVVTANVPCKGQHSQDRNSCLGLEIPQAEWHHRVWILPPRCSHRLMSGNQEAQCLEQFIDVLITDSES